MSVSNQFSLNYSHGSTNVHIHGNVLDRWNFHRQYNAYDIEKFGVLIASKTLNKTEYWIEQITEPYPKDSSSRYGFQLRDTKHQETVNAVHRKTKGESGYFGTWHTHPEPIPSPSALDKRDWQKCIEENRDRTLFFAIAGTKQISIFYKPKNSFVALKRQRNAHNRF